MGKLLKFFGLENDSSSSSAQTPGEGLLHGEPSRKEAKDSASILKELRHLETELHGMGGLIPNHALVLCYSIVDLEREVLSLTTELPSSTKFMLEKVATDYLPNLVKAYANTVRSGGGSSSNDENLMEHLSTLRESVLEVKQAVHDNNLIKLDSEGVFLQTKFGGSSLEDSWARG